jgi:hypothetical protein
MRTFSTYLLLASATLTLGALGFVGITPTAEAGCVVNAAGGSCNGNCEVNISSTCAWSGNCDVNVSGYCSGNCWVNVAGSCTYYGTCPVNVLSTCTAFI